MLFGFIEGYRELCKNKKLAIFFVVECGPGDQRMEGSDGSFAADSMAGKLWHFPNKRDSKGSALCSCCEKATRLGGALGGCFYQAPG